jgi:hypothetical protein
MGIQWTGGAGTFSPSTTANTVNYTPTNAEILAGSIVITATTTTSTPCNPISDNITVIIAPAPTVSAGADLVLCGSTPSVNLAGLVTGSTGGRWTTSGTGTFADENSANTSYTPSVADKTAGLVTLTLTTTGNGTCNAISDQMVLTFTVVPTINAGPDIATCANTLPVTLSGSGTPATWSGGTGTFANANSMNSTYNPSGPEITTGTVTLTLTTNPTGACPQISDQVTITISPSPLANAGADQTVCGNTNIVNILGTVNAQATGGFWTTTGTGSFADPTALTTTYSPSLADKTAGTVTLRLTTVGNGICGPHFDEMDIRLGVYIFTSVLTSIWLLA